MALAAPGPLSDALGVDIEAADKVIVVIYDGTSEACCQAMDLVRHRESTLPLRRPTVRLHEWPSPDAEAALAQLPSAARPRDVRGRVVARLPSGLVLPRCERDVMELIYEMEYLALLQPPDPSRANTIAQAFLRPGGFLEQVAEIKDTRRPTPSCASAERWWAAGEVYEAAARSLGEAGFCVVDDFLSPQAAEDLLRGTLAARPRMEPGVHGVHSEVFDSEGHSNNPKRCDLILFSDDYSGMPGYPSLVDAVDKLVLGLKHCSSCAEVSDRLRFVDFANNAQFAIYPGNASRYVRHADNSLGDGRRITAILYLNKDWQPAHGGRLRIFEPTLTRVKADLDPVWNRLVLFWSTDEVPHEVLASYRDRVAVSIWYLCGREAMGSRAVFPRLFDASPFRVLEGRGRVEALAEAAETEEQRRALAEVPLDAASRSAYLAIESPRLERLFTWRPAEARAASSGVSESRPPATAAPATAAALASVVVRPVERAAAEEVRRIGGLQAEGRPVLVEEGLPGLSGAKVLQFMPALVQAAGGLVVDYEKQGPGGEVATERASIRELMQKLETSAPGHAYLMASHEALGGARLKPFLEAPGCCEPDLLGSLPPEMRPERRRVLVLGGRGALSRLSRNPLTGGVWHALVLGEQQWRLYPPEAQPASSCTSVHEWGSATSPANGFAPTDEDWSCEGAPAEVWEATQRMGEVLLIPPGWWCQARHADKTLGITVQYATPGMIPLVVDQLSQWKGTPVPGGEPLQALQQLRDAFLELHPSRRLATGSAASGAGRSEEEGSKDRNGAREQGAAASLEASWCAVFLNLARRRDRRRRLTQLLEVANAPLLQRLERIDAVDGRQLSFDDPLVKLAVDAPALQRARKASQSGACTIVHEGGDLLHFDNHLTLGAVACALSHRMALERLVVHPSAQWALVLEDDVCAVVPQADQAIFQLLQQLPDDWDALFLGYHAANGRLAEPGVGAAAALPLVWPLFGLYAWVVRREAAEALLENVFPISGQIDYAITNWLVNERGRSFAVDPGHMLFFSPKSEVAEDSDIQTMTTLGAMMESHGSWEGYCNRVYGTDKE